MKFSKYNNPNKRRRKRTSPYSDEYVQEQKMKLVDALSSAQTEKEKLFLVQAYSISVNP